MKTIILKNTTSSNISIESLGLTILKQENVTIDSSDLIRLSMNDELFSLIQSGSIVVNNGSKDLNYNESKLFLQPVSENIFSTFVHAHSKNEISDFTHDHDDKYFTEDEITTNYFNKNYISSNFSTISHDHDTQYYIKENVYTKSELQTSGSSQINWNNLTSVPSTFTPSAHSHDDRYYTELESDAKYSLLAHIHDDRYYTETEINNNLYTKTQLDVGQLDSRYYTKSQLQTTGSSQVSWGNLTSVPATFTPSTHSHDDRYYTQSILDTKFGLYYTKTEVNSITSGYYTKTESDNKYSVVSHAHDDRYYTDTEIDQMITASTFGIAGAVDTYADLPVTTDTGIMILQMEWNMAVSCK